MTIPCPFVYADGKRCPGHIVKVEVYKADITWELGPTGQWRVAWDPRSHYHLFCSDKGNHAGYGRRHHDRMKFFWDTLAEEARRLLMSTSVTAEPNRG